MPIVTVEAHKVGNIIFSCHDDFLYKVMNMTKKIYEHALLEYIADTVPRNGIAIDVGACIGTHSVVFSKLGFTVLAFEPVLENAALLQENIDANGVTDQVTALCVALGAHAGRVRMHLNYTNWGMCCIMENDVPGETPLFPLTAFVPPTQPVALLKIDVEGYELSVLQGALSLLERSHPRLFIEVTGDTRPSVEALLVPLGYRRGGRFSTTPRPIYEYINEERSVS